MLLCFQRVSYKSFICVQCMIYKLVSKFMASVFVDKLKIAELEKKLLLLSDTQ